MTRPTPEMGWMSETCLFVVVVVVVVVVAGEEEEKEVESGEKKWAPPLSFDVAAA